MLPTAFSKVMAKHAYLLIGIVDCRQISLSFRSNAVAALLVLGHFVKDLGSLLRALGSYMRAVIELELEEQHKYIPNSLMLASTIVQQHLAAQCVMKDQQGLLPEDIEVELDVDTRAGFSKDTAAVLASVIGVLLMQHCHQIKQFGLACGSDPDANAEIDKFRNEHDVDQRDLIVFTAFDFFQALFLAGVEVWREVKIPAHGDNGTHSFECFKESMAEYYETTMEVAGALNNKKAKSQIPMERGSSRGGASR